MEKIGNFVTVTRPKRRGKKGREIVIDIKYRQ
jgi:hypothetical protein